jgi:hypothetical protein
MAQRTYDNIKGARHKAMLELGHFRATKNLGRFVPHLVETGEFIQRTREM